MAMKIRLFQILALIGTFPAAVNAAENAYVIDKLLVGVHQDQNLTSAIIKVLPTGTKLEVLKREGELALVKDAQGASGWVDSAYLMEAAPASRPTAQTDRGFEVETGGLIDGGHGANIERRTRQVGERKYRVKAQVVRRKTQSCRNANQADRAGS